MNLIKELDQPVIKAGNAVRDYLIEMASDDNLPMDMTEISARVFSDIIRANVFGVNPETSVYHNLFSGTPLRKMMSGSDILDTYPEFFYTERTGENECAFCGRNGAIIHSVIGKVADLKNRFTDTGMVIEKVMVDGRLTDIKVVSILLNIKRSTINEYNQNAR